MTPDNQVTRSFSSIDADERDIVKKTAGRAPAAASQSLSAVAKVFYALCDQSEIGVLELARRVSVSVGTAQRITSALVQADLLSCSPYTHKYSLGKGVLRLANAYTQQTSPDLQRCMAEMESLASLTGETTAIHRRFGLNRVVVAQITSNHEMSWRSDIGRGYPLHAGAASKALLAFLPPAELETILATLSFERFQPQTAATRKDLEAELRHARTIGAAVSFGERVVGAGGIAAPVLDVNGRPEYALSVYGPEHRIRPLMDNLIRTVREAAMRASDYDFADFPRKP